MKPTTVIDMHRTGDLGGDKIAMTVDENSLAHIMALLTDLYSDPVMAIVREYLTNARDSHVDAGQTRPIEVTLPNSMSPYWKVRDFGVGLNVQDVADIYSKYGASTKRASDTVTGMLGLGCKSALTYTSQFTVTAIKNGVKAIVMVSRVEDGTGVMEVVDETSTSEPNGVEISVPVRPGNDFATKTYTFLSYWEPGLVLVNGKAPDQIKIDYVTNTAGMVQGSGDDVIVMGGVPYPVQDNYNLYSGNRGSYYDTFRIVAFVEMGAVNFTPSREALNMTNLTKTTIERVRAEVNAEMRNKIQADIDALPTEHQALVSYHEWNKKVGTAITSGVTYRGVNFPSVIKGLHLGARWDERGHPNVSNINSDDWNCNVAVLSEAIFITGFDFATIGSHHKKKIRQWAQDKGIRKGRYVYFIVGQIPDSTWIDPARIVTWADIKAIKVYNPNAGQGGPRKAPSIDTYNANGALLNAPVDNTKQLVYVSPRDELTAGAVRAVYQAFPNVQIVSLGANRWGKFARENPGALPLRDYVRTQINAARDNLTLADFESKSMDYHERNTLRLFDERRIDDPAFAAAVKVAKDDYQSDTLDKYEAAKNAGAHLHIIESDFPTRQHIDLDNYPLLSQRGYGIVFVVDHTYLYLNAVYAAQTANP